VILGDVEEIDPQARRVRLRGGRRCGRGAAHAAVRLPDPRLGLRRTLLRPRRVRAIRTRLEVARGCPRDPPPSAPRVRACRSRDEPAGTARAHDLRHRRRRSHRRRACRRPGRPRPPHTAERVSPPRSTAGPLSVGRGRPACVAPKIRPGLSASATGTKG
jgi:hypothetical protein